MTITLDPSEEFAKALDRLNELVILGKAHVAIGRGLSAKLAADPVLAHVARVFWGTTITSHFDAALLDAFRLFDSQGNALTIQYLLKLARNTPFIMLHAKPDDVAEIVRKAEERIEQISQNIHQIDRKRSRVLAHSDPTIIRVPGSLAEDTKVKLADLIAVFDAASHILNDLSVAFKDASQLWDLMDGEDYETAVQLIVDAKHGQADAYEREFGPAPFERPKTPKSLA